MTEKLSSAITNITLDRATFCNEEIDDLSYINFFYGNNGTGKSSIARAIAENDGIVWADEKNRFDYEVLVYDQTFINDNFQSYDNLDGVFLFGKEDIGAQAKIEELTKRKNEKSDERAEIHSELEDKKDRLEWEWDRFRENCFKKTATIRKYFDKCLTGKKRKDTFSNAVLNETKPTGHDLIKLERLYDTAFGDISRTYPIFICPDIQQAYNGLRGKSLLNQVVVGSSDTPFSNFIKALGATASAWVREGHSHYSALAGEKCPYCQQILPATFEKDIAACFDAQYQQDIQDIVQFKNAYEREMTEDIRMLKSNMEDVLDTVDLEDYQEKLRLLESRFEINCQRISEKCKDPSIIVSLEKTDSLLLEINSIIENINKIISENNQIVSEKRKNQAKCTDEIIQYFAFMLADKVKDINAIDKRLNTEIRIMQEREKELQNEINELTTEICSLNKRNVNTEAAVDNINKILKETGFQGFSIRKKENFENVYEIVREDGSIAENLSDGERNFIAFLYFYHLVLGSKNRNENKEKIIVIDDPVSNMDNTAIFAVSSIVREMIKVCRNKTNYADTEIADNYIEQMFILTHSTYFYNAISCQQAAYCGCTSFYTVKKNDNISMVKTD